MTPPDLGRITAQNNTAAAADAGGISCGSRRAKQSDANEYLRLTVQR
jgi:hypothetical protein